MRNITKKWLYENAIKYDKIIFAKSSKLQYCIDNKIDIMIEDDVNNINELSLHMPIICYHADYNKNCNASNIIRCYSWYDVYKAITGNIE